MSKPYRLAVQLIAFATRFPASLSQSGRFRAQLAHLFHPGTGSDRNTVLCPVGRCEA
jgi:hypothetical protein